MDVPSGSRQAPTEPAHASNPTPSAPIFGASRLLRLRPDGPAALARTREAMRTSIRAGGQLAESVLEPMWLPLECLMGRGGHPSLCASLAAPAPSGQPAAPLSHTAMQYGLAGAAMCLGQVAVLLGCVAMAGVVGAAIGAGLGASLVVMKLLFVSSLSSSVSGADLMERFVKAWADDTFAGLQTGSMLGLCAAAGACSIFFMPLDTALDAARFAVQTSKHVTLSAAHACGSVIGCGVAVPAGALIGLWALLSSMSQRPATSA